MEGGSLSFLLWEGEYFCREVVILISSGRDIERGGYVLYVRIQLVAFFFADSTLYGIFLFKFLRLYGQSILLYYIILLHFILIRKTLEN